MFPKTIALITTGVFVAALLVALGFLGFLSWVIVGVLCSIVIGVFTWLISLVSRARETDRSIENKATKKTVSKRWIVNKEILLEGRDYEQFSIDMEKGEHLVGEVSSEEAINVFLVNKYGLSKFENQEDFSYEDCGGGEGIRRTRIDFVPSKNGRWVLVVENEADDDVNVEVQLFVTSS